MYLIVTKSHDILMPYVRETIKRSSSKHNERLKRCHNILTNKLIVDICEMFRFKKFRPLNQKIDSSNLNDYILNVLFNYVDR